MIILLLVGLAGLWLGTRWIMNGALGVARRFNLSHTFVGLGILAVGTDLPEVFITVDAAILHLNGIESSGIITGNAIGSNISQITLVLGIAGMLLKFKIARADLKRDAIALVTAIVLVYYFGRDGVVSRLEGIVLISVYFLYYYFLMRMSAVETGSDERTEGPTTMALIFFLLGGFGVLIFSSKLVVDNAMLLASSWGVSQSFVGITIIGVGTSLPELAVTVGAAMRKSTGLTVGNIIGSNIFDGFIPIGLGGVISTTNVEPSLLAFDLPVLLLITCLVLLALRSKQGISIPMGIVLVVIFLIYIAMKAFLLEGIFAG